jgi:hypothetical protein
MHQYTSKVTHGAETITTARKTAIFILAAVRTWNLTNSSLSLQNQRRELVHKVAMVVFLHILHNCHNHPSVFSHATKPLQLMQVVHEIRWSPSFVVVNTPVSCVWWVVYREYSGDSVVTLFSTKFRVAVWSQVAQYRLEYRLRHVTEQALWLVWSCHVLICLHRNTVTIVCCEKCSIEKLRTTVINF